MDAKKGKWAGEMIILFIKGIYIKIVLEHLSREIALCMKTWYEKDIS